MEEIGLVAKFGELLALCGITSMRCFLPTFAVCLLCRTGLPFGLETVELTQLTHQMPAALLSTGGLCVLGFMAVLELLANWNQTVRELFADFNWENYVKPTYAFLFALIVGAPDSAAPLAAGVGDAAAQVASVVSNAVASVGESVSQVAPAVASAVVQGVPPDAVPNSEGFSLWAWITTVVPAGAAALGTNLLCSFKRKIADLIRMIDPDNSFKLQSVACAVEESAWVVFALVAVLVPVLAIFLMLLAAALGYAVMQILKALENKNSHDCPQCAGRVHNSAIQCPHCRADQPTPYCAVGFRGLASRRSVDATQPAAVHAHHLQLLMEHRCPICATPLIDQQTCSHCGTPIWKQGVTRQEIVKILDARMIGGVVGGLFASAIPVLGFVATVVYFNMRCLRILRGYETRGSLFVTRVLFPFAKWTILIFSCIFSAIPGVSILFMVPYGFSYWRSRGRFLRVVNKKGDDEMFCTDCGKENPDTADSCASCGAVLKAEATPSPTSTTPDSANQTKLIAGILAILFGGLGVHKFYLGYTTSGLIMLAITLVSCCALAPVVQIIGLVEGIMYLTQTDADFKKNYIDSKKEWF